MAKPTTTTFGHIVVYVGDGATPETFSAPCGLTSKSFGYKADTSSTPVPDCDDPDAPAWDEPDVKTLSFPISGEGVIALESLKVWRTWAASGKPRNLRVVVNEPLANGGGMWSGAGLLTEFTGKGALGEKPTFSVNIASKGEWIWTDAGA